MSKLLFQNLPRCLGSTFLSTRLTSTMAKVQYLNDARPISEMPGPLCFPILGSVPSILLAAGKVKQPHLIWEMMVKKYGPISKFKFMGMPAAMILTLPDDIEKVYRYTMENPIRNGFASLKKVRYEEEDNYFEHKGGILVENNDERWRVRSRVQAPMLRPKSISKYISQMDEVTLDFMERFLSHTLGFTLYLLAKNPRAQKRLQQEVDSVLGDGQGAITESQLARLSFLKACVKESLRIFPLTIGNARVLTQDLVLCGLRVPKGAFAMNIVTSNDDSLFPRAKEFLPERWGRDQPFGPIHPYASLPFFMVHECVLGEELQDRNVHLFGEGKVKQPHLIWEMMVKKYGPISKFKLMGMPAAVILSLPDDIEKVYRYTMENPIRNGFASLKKVRYEEEDNYFEHKGGILVENNDEWWRVRSRVQAPMLRPKSMSKYISQMDEVTLDFMERIAVLQNTLGEMPANFLQELYKWSLESVSLVALNKRLGCLRSDLSNDSPQIQLINTVNGIFEHLNATEMFVQLWRLFPTPSFKRLKEAHDKFLRIANAHIKEAELQLVGKKGSYEGDADAIPFLQRLLQEEHLSRKDVLTVILDMLFAGIDTTSHTLGFTLYLLAKNPRAQKRLQQEVDSVLGDGKEAITESQLARLSFLKACVKESLRIFPLAIGNARVLTQDLVLSGYRVPKGAFALNIVTSHDESLFPRAKEFLPERWGRDQPFGPIHPYASLPFSHGPRMCIGRRVAEQEMYIFLARVFQRFNIDYKYKEMTIVTRLVSLPSEPLKFQFTEREKLTNQIGSRNS